MDENYRDAYQAFEQCIEMDRNYGRAHLMMGYCALETGMIDEAIKRLNTASEFPEYRGTALKLLKRAEAEKQ
jgi:Tfp pilus assembly protein PilF